MGLPKPVSVLSVVVLFVFAADSVLAESNEQKISKPESSLDDPAKSSENANKLSSHTHLDGVSFELAVRIGLPLGPLIRGKKLSEELQRKQPAIRPMSDE